MSNSLRLNGVQTPMQLNNSRYHTAVYHRILRRLLKLHENNSAPRLDRTGVGTVSIFGTRHVYCLKRNLIPVLSSKSIHLRSLIGELIWMLQGHTSVLPLKEAKISIWNEWADTEGNLGPVYGYQWRKLETDQVAEVVRLLKKDPTSRRIMVSAWNVDQLRDMKLPPCHVLWQLYVENDGSVSMQMYQRSADVFLGVPFNIASYSILLHLICKLVGRKPNKLIHIIGDLHLYVNHIEQAKLQLQRIPRQSPTITIDTNFNSLEALDTYCIDGTHQVTGEPLVTINDYYPDAAIKAPVAV